MDTPEPAYDKFVTRLTSLPATELGAHAMKVGIGIGNFSWPVTTDEIGSVISRIAVTADEAGFDSLWVMDHFFQIRLTGLPPESPMFEAYATLGFLAGQTRRIRLGTIVTSVAYRHPGVLVKSVTSLDVLSGGRVFFGVGAGAPWNVSGSSRSAPTPATCSTCPAPSSRTTSPPSCAYSGSTARRPGVTTRRSRRPCPATSTWGRTGRRACAPCSRTCAEPPRRGPTPPSWPLVIPGMTPPSRPTRRSCRTCTPSNRAPQ